MKARNLFEARGAFSADRYIARGLYESIFAGDVLFFEENDNRVKVDCAGGIVTFSTDMNSTSLSGNAFVNWVKQKVYTVRNRLAATSKIDRVANSFNLAGWTITRGLHGRYRDRVTGKMFDENSISIELIGIDNETLLSFAESLCVEFGQQSVLVKSYNTTDVWFVENPEGIR